MIEVSTDRREDLPENIEEIFSTPGTFLFYLKTQLAMFAKALAHYERDAVLSEVAVMDFAKDDFLKAVREKKKACLKDASAAEEVQNVTREKFKGNNFLFDNLDFEKLREKHADVYLDFEKFAAEFNENMHVIVDRLSSLLNYVSDWRTNWLNNKDIGELLDFLDQLDRGEIEFYSATIDYLSQSSGSEIVTIKDQIRDAQCSDVLDDTESDV